MKNPVSEIKLWAIQRVDTLDFAGRENRYWHQKNPRMFTRLSHLSNHLNQSAVMKTYVQGPTVHYRDVALHNLRVVEYGLSVPGRGELGAHKIKLIPMAEFFNTEKFLNAN